MFRTQCYYFDILFAELINIVIWYCDAANFGGLTSTLQGGVCMFCLFVLIFFFITSYTGNHIPTAHFHLTHCMCLKQFMTIIHQTLWPLDRQHIPALPCAPTSLLSVLQAIKLKRPKICLLKMPEIFQIRTQEPILPHKIAKVCTVHNVLRLLGHCPYSSLIPPGMVQPRFP